MNKILGRNRGVKTLKRAPRETIKKEGYTLFLRGKNWSMQATFNRRQRMVALGTESVKTAEARALRFLATYEANGWETAQRELKGGDPVKKGDPLTFERISQLYREYLETLGSHAPRENTVKLYLYSLKRIMTKSRAATVQKIDAKEVTKNLRPANPTPAQGRTFASIVRNAASVFCKGALLYYAERGFTISNPLERISRRSDKVKRYETLGEATRQNIWQDCRKELPPQEAMIILLGLGTGLRRAEIEAARLDWFVPQSEGVDLNVRNGDGFLIKTELERTVPIPFKLYEELLQLRAEAVAANPKLQGSPYLIPIHSRTGKRCLLGRCNKVNTWLKEKGVRGQKALHGLRKEFGSLYAQTTGSIFETARVLGNTATVAETHYLGVVNRRTVDVGGLMDGRESELAELKRENAELREEIRKQGQEFREILAKLAAR